MTFWCVNLRKCREITEKHTSPPSSSALRFPPCRQSNVFVPSYRMMSGAKELVPKGYKRLDAAAEAATHLLERHIGLIGAGRMISFHLVSICCMKITLILRRNRYPWSIFIQSCLSLQLKYLIIVAIQSYNVYHNMCATSMIKLIQKNHDQDKQMIPWRIWVKTKALAVVPAFVCFLDCRTGVRRPWIVRECDYFCDWLLVKKMPQVCITARCFLLNESLP